MIDSSVGSGSSQFAGRVKTGFAKRKLGSKKRAVSLDRFEMGKLDVSSRRNPDRTKSRIEDRPTKGIFSEQWDFSTPGARPRVKIEKPKQHVASVVPAPVLQAGKRQLRVPGVKTPRPTEGPLSQKLDTSTPGAKPKVKIEISEIPSLPDAEPIMQAGKRRLRIPGVKTPRPETGPLSRNLDTSVPGEKAVRVPRKTLNLHRTLSPKIQKKHPRTHSGRSQSDHLSNALHELGQVANWTKDMVEGASVGFAKAGVPVNLIHDKNIPSQKPGGASYPTRIRKQTDKASQNDKLSSSKDTKIVHKGALPKREHSEEELKAFTRASYGLDFLDNETHSSFFGVDHFDKLMQLGMAGKLSFAQVDGLKAAVQKKRAQHEIEQKKAEKEFIEGVQKKRDELASAPAQMQASKIFQRRRERLNALAFDPLVEYRSQCQRFENELNAIHVKREQARRKSMFANDPKEKTLQIVDPYIDEEVQKKKEKPKKPYGKDAEPLSPKTFKSIMTSSKDNPAEGKVFQQLLHKDSWGNTLMNPRPFHQMSMTQEGLHVVGKGKSTTVSETYTPSLRETANEESPGRDALAEYELKKKPKSKKEAQLERIKAEKDGQKLKAYLEGNPDQLYTAKLYGIDVIHTRNGQVVEFPGNNEMNQSLRDKPRSVDELSEELFQKSLEE